MFYTSGTTGRPKGVRAAGPRPCRRSQTLQLLASGLVAGLQLPSDGTTLLCGPYYHSAQWALAFQPMLVGLSVVMTQRFDAAQTLQLIDRHRVTNLHLVPTQFIRLLRLDAEVKRSFDGDIPGARLARCRALPAAGQARHDRLVGTLHPRVLRLHRGFGGQRHQRRTEWLQRPASVGRATFQTEVLILRDDGSPAPPGEQGTIYLRSRSGVRLRYHNDPDKTAGRAPRRRACSPPATSAGWTTRATCT